MKNILLASSTVMPAGGGIASYAFELIKALSGNYNIYVITDEKKINGYDNDIISLLSTYGNDPFSYEYGKIILEYIVEKRINLIINSNSTIISILAPFIHVPIISISHFTDGTLALRAGYNARYISRIVALSQSAKQYLEKRYKISDKTKVNVIYNFIHNNYPAQNKIAQSPLVIVYPGGCSPHKRPDLVYKALKKLLKTSLDFRFIWLGDTTVPLNRFSVKKNLKDFLAFDNRVIFTDRVSRKDALEYIGRCNIFLLPSKGEGCAMTLLEALNGGCIPVVTDDPHASKEILNDGKFGIVINGANSNKLFESLQDIISNPYKYESAYWDTQKYVEEKLSQKIWTKKMTELINEALVLPKESIPYNIINHRGSVEGYKKLFRRENFIEKIVRFRCYANFLFYSLVHTKK